MLLHLSSHCWGTHPRRQERQPGGRGFVAGVLVHVLPTASRAQPPAGVDSRPPGPSTEKIRRAAGSRASRHPGFLWSKPCADQTRPRLSRKPIRIRMDDGTHLTRCTPSPKPVPVGSTGRGWPFHGVSMASRAASWYGNHHHPRVYTWRSMIGHAASQ